MRYFEKFSVFLSVTVLFLMGSAGLLADDIRVVGVLPGDCKTGMAQSLLYIQRIRASLQQQGCVRVTKAVEVKKGHVEFLVNDPTGVL